ALTPGRRSNAEVQAACWLAHSLDRRTQISAHSRESGRGGYKPLGSRLRGDERNVKSGPSVFERRQSASSRIRKKRDTRALIRGRGNVQKSAAIDYKHDG